MTLKLGDVVGGCELVSELGEGGMGTVYRANQVSLGREVAIKLMLEASGQEQRFHRESKIHITLNHPGVVRVYDSGTENGRDYLVMELVRGQVLDDVIEREKPMPIAKAVAIARDIADALAYLHARGIVHRDLKPRNVFLTEDLRAKVGDFGLAWADGATVLTQQGSLVGTVKYMAPETVAGAEPGAPSDMYAMGIFLYVMITGQLPYEGRSMQDWLQRIPVVIPPRASTLRPDLPRELDDLLARLLAKPARDRATAEEARTTLAALLGEAPSEQSIPGPRSRSKSGATRRPASMASRVPEPRGWSAPGAVSRALGAAICAFALTAGAGWLAHAQRAGATALELLPPVVEAPAAATRQRSVPLVKYPDTSKANAAWRELHRLVRGVPLDPGRQAAGFLIGDPARIVSISVEPRSLVAVNGALPASAQVPVVPLALHAGWNVIEWARDTDLSHAQLTLTEDTNRPLPAEIVTQLPPSFQAREAELWRLYGGGFTISEAEKEGRALVRDLPGQSAPLRLLGTVLVIQARHRHEIQREKASETLIGAAGMLASDSRPTTDMSAEGLAWLFRAIDREPRDAEAWAYLGAGFAVLGRFDLSDDALQHAQARGPKTYAAWYQVYEVAEIARVDGKNDSKRHDRTLAALRVAQVLNDTIVHSPVNTRQVAGALRQLAKLPAY